MNITTFRRVNTKVLWQQIQKELMGTKTFTKGMGKPGYDNLNALMNKGAWHHNSLLKEYGSLEDLGL
jgi:hypothetical protein